jgi:hypothetical protein
LTPSGLRIYNGGVTARVKTMSFRTQSVVLGTLAIALATPAAFGQKAAVYLLLGGGSGTYTIAQLYPDTPNLNGSFDDGNPSMFAQQHLRNGARP